MKPTRDPDREEVALAIEAVTLSLIVGGGLVYALIQGLLTLF
jgi:hypothetical protein